MISLTVTTYCACDAEGCDAVDSKEDKLAVGGVVPVPKLPIGWTVLRDDVRGNKLYCPRHRPRVPGAEN